MLDLFCNLRESTGQISPVSYLNLEIQYTYIGWKQIFEINVGPKFIHIPKAILKNFN